MKEELKEQVVKCKKCQLHFGYVAGGKTACPFCQAAYVEEIVLEVQEEAKEQPKEEIEPAKPQKKSFKMWKDS